MSKFILPFAITSSLKTHAGMVALLALARTMDYAMHDPLNLRNGASPPPYVAIDTVGKSATLIGEDEREILERHEFTLSSDMDKVFALMVDGAKDMNTLLRIHAEQEYAYEQMRNITGAWPQNPEETATKH